jgi:hypothetical protein
MKFGPDAIKFVPSSSSATGQNAILGKGNGAPNLVQGKFGKAKAEKSPSVERLAKQEVAATAAEAAAAADIVAGDNVDRFGATPGHTQAVPLEVDDLMSLEQKAADDAKRHKRAIEGDVGKTKEEEAAAELWSWRKDLDLEQQKRRDLEDQLDDLKLEVGYNREACAKTTHVVGKMLIAQLQEAEKNDQTTIMVVKKRSEKMRAFFESYKALQNVAAKEAIIVSVANNGPMVSVKVVAPEKIREAMTILHNWQRSENLEVAVFRGKTSLTQMLELPIRGAHRAMLNQMNMDARGAKEAGLSTCWMDQDKRWSICFNGIPHIRGQMSVETLDAEIFVSLEFFIEQGAEQVVADIKKFEADDRNGCIFEQSFKKLDLFSKSGPNVHNWGRQSKGGGKGGKGDKGY